MSAVEAERNEEPSTSGRLFNDVANSRLAPQQERQTPAQPSSSCPTNAHFWSFAGPGPHMGNGVVAESGQPGSLGSTGQISLAQAAFDEDRPESLRKRAWSLKDSQKALNRDFSSPGKTTHLMNTTSRDESVTSRRTGSFADRNPIFSEVNSGWVENSVLDSRNDMNIMQSMAVHPSDRGLPSQLATGFSFSEMPLPQNLLSTRHSIDAENRLNQENVHRAEKPVGVYESCPDIRKGMIEDSAREVENQSDLLPHRKSLMKASQADAAARQVPGSAHKQNVSERQAAAQAARHGGHRSKQPLSKSQTEFIGPTPMRSGSHKKHPGLFARHPGNGGLHKQPGWQNLPINRLDARSEKAMNSHDRIMAWLEQGERHMLGMQPLPYTPSAKAPVAPTTSFATSHSKAAVKSVKQKEAKPRSRWRCSLPCLAA